MGFMWISNETKKVHERLAYLRGYRAGRKRRRLDLTRKELIGMFDKEEGDSESPNYYLGSERMLDLLIEKKFLEVKKGGAFDGEESVLV